MDNPIQRYVGGGKVYFANYNGTDYEQEREIGEVLGANLKLSPSYADAVSKDSGMAKKVDKVITSTEASISFETQNVNKENMAIAMMAELSEKTFAIGDMLPNGRTAKEEKTVTVLQGGLVSKVQGRLKIVGLNVTGGDDPVLEIPMVVLTPSGDIRDYFTDKHSTISFDGEILESSGKYFTEYLIPKD